VLYLLTVFVNPIGVTRRIPLVQSELFLLNVYEEKFEDTIGVNRDLKSKKNRLTNGKEQTRIYKTLNGS